MLSRRFEAGQRFVAFILGAAMLAVLAGAGCSERESPSSPTEAGLGKAAREQSEALFEGDEETAYGFFSSECKKSISARDYRQELSVARTFFKQFTGADLEDVKVSAVQVRDFTPERAEVLVEVATPPESAMPLGDDEWQEWVFEDGRWALNDCEASMFGG